MLSSSSVGLLGLLSCSALQLGAARRQFVDTVKVAEADRSAMAAKIYHHNKVLEKRLASGWAPPQPNRSNRRSLGKRQSGNQADLDLTLTVSAGLDSSYFTNITIGQGDEATEFAVIPDTGSADLWVPEAGNGFSPSYDCESSSSCEDLNEQWSIQYGSGPAAGHLIRDVVTLHGLEVENQTMALADTGLNTLLTSDFDGILGLAFSSIAETQEPTVVENLLSEGVISNHLFGVYMARSSDDVKGDSEDDYYSAVSEYINENGYGGLGKRQETVSASGAPTDTELGGLGDDPFGDGDEPLPSATGDSGGGSSGGFRQPTTQVDGGVIHLGYANEDFYQGDINYQDLSFAGYWQIEIDGFTDGGDSISGTDQYTILDTGTTLIYMPIDAASAFFDSIGAEAIRDSSYEGYYAMDCDDLDDLDIGVRLGGSTYKINPSDLDLGEFTSGTCVIGVIAADTQDLEGNYLGILGAAFLKNVYSVYDIEGQRVGVAELSDKHSDKSSDAGSANNDSDSDSNDDDDSAANVVSAATLLVVLLSVVTFSFA